MKKVVSLVLALVFVLTLTVSFAENAASRNNFNGNVIINDDVPLAGSWIEVIEPEVDENVRRAEACFAERSKLAAAESVAAYFDGIDLTAFVEGETLVCHEMEDIAAGGWTEDMEDPEALLQFATPYQDGEKVALIIGVIDEDEMTWTAYEGVGFGIDEESGLENGIRVILPIEIVLAIQDADCLVAVVNAD